MCSFVCHSQDSYLYFVGILAADKAVQPRPPPCLSSILRNIKDTRLLYLALREMPDTDWNAMTIAKEIASEWEPISDAQPFGLPDAWWHTPVPNYRTSRRTELVVTEATTFFRVSSGVANSNPEADKTRDYGHQAGYRPFKEQGGPNCSPSGRHCWPN